MQNQKLTEPLEFTQNNLSDVIKWLQDGHYVVIHAENGRFFHKCNNNITDKEVEEYINSHRIIYVNVTKLPGLLDDGEWNFYYCK